MRNKSILMAIPILLFGCFVIPAQAEIQPSFQGLGDLPSGSFESTAHGVSADGSVVVGYSHTSSGWEAFRWENGTMVGLGELPGGRFESMGWGVSANGSVVVGYSISTSGYLAEAFRWENGKMVGMGFLPGGRGWSEAYDVSADGSVVVGKSWSSSSTQAFRWEDLNGNGKVDPDEKLDYHPEFGLGHLPGGVLSMALGISADGLVAVGFSLSASGYEAFRWENGETVGLGDLPGGYFSSRARSVSANGSTVVGESSTASGHEAFIWNITNGMQNLKDVLVNDYGLDLTGWTLYRATGISADGLTIVGNGYNPAGYTEGWIARLSKPVLMVEIDIKPGSCPNPVNVKSKGVLPVAILGTDDLNVITIDPTSIRLAGVGPLRSGYEDVAGFIEDANDCQCTTLGPDGFLDLTLKFKTQEIVEAIGDVNDGDVLTLELTGVLSGEIPIGGADCILIRGRHKPINPADINKDGVVDAVDFAIFAQNWLQSSIVDE